MALLAMLVLLGLMATLWRSGPYWGACERRQRVAGLAAVAVIAVSLVDERTAWDLRLLPGDDWLFFQRVPLYAAIFALLTVAWWGARRARRVAIGTLTALFGLYALLEVAGPAFLPLVAGQLDATTWGHGRYATEVQQSTGWSCGPAALAWALRVRGQPASERELARLSGTMPLHGSTWRGMLRAVHALGLEAQVRTGATWPDLLTAPKPALADWRLNAATSHMIVILAANDQTVRVGDPLLGEADYAAADFLRQWQRGLLVLRGRGPTPAAGPGLKPSRVLSPAVRCAPLRAEARPVAAPGSTSAWP